MRKSKVSTWNLARFQKEMGNKVISFDYPIQRAGGQWDDEKKSLLIHSIVCDFPVPPVYALAQHEIVGDKQKEVLYILDGKQRLTSLSEFLNNGFRLHKNTPIFNIEESGEVEEHDFVDYNYEELPEPIQKLIQSYIIEIVKIENALDSDVEDIFYRLNNGVPLSTQQKAKAKLGAEMALKLKSAMEHPLLSTNAVFTELQCKQAQDEVALVQSMMLIDNNFQVGKFGTKDVSDYTALLRDGKDDVLQDLQKALDFLHETLGDSKEKVLLKKINFPFVVFASHEAVKKGLSSHTFKYWVEGFKEKLASKTNGMYLDGAENPNAWLYKIGSGAGATKAEKVAQRLKATKDELEAFYKELEDEAKEEEKARQEIQRLREEKEREEKEQAENKANKANEQKDKKENNKNNSKNNNGKPVEQSKPVEQGEQGKLEV